MAIGKDCLRDVGARRELRRPEVFFARVAEVGLEDSIGKMKQAWLSTCAKRAFGSDSSTNAPEPSALTNEMLAPRAG